MCRSGCGVSRDGKELVHMEGESATERLQVDEYIEEVVAGVVAVVEQKFDEQRRSLTGRKKIRAIWKWA